MAVNPRTGQSDIRSLLAQQLLAQGSSQQPIRNPVEGAGRLAQTLSGALISRKLGEEQKQEGADRNAALADALRVSQGRPAEAVTTPGGETINFEAQPGNQNLALSNLLQNQNTADLPLTQQLLAKQLSPGQATKFGQPVAGVGPDGAPQFRRFGPGGESQPVEGFAPAQKTPLVTIDNKGEGKEQEELATLRVDRFGKLQNQADAARGSLSTIDQLEFGMEGFETGSFGESRLALGRVAQFFGVDPEGLNLGNIESGEAFQAAANKLALKARAGEGTPLTGNTSDKDLQFLVNSTANIGKTKRGNEIVIGFMRRASERVLEKEAAANDWLEESGSLRGFQASWSKFERQNPVFTDQDRASLTAATKRPKSMTIDELTALDASSLTPNELKEASARFQELGR